MRSVWSAPLRVLHVLFAEPDKRFHAAESVSDGEMGAGSRLSRFPLAHEPSLAQRSLTRNGKPPRAPRSP